MFILKGYLKNGSKYTNISKYFNDLDEFDKFIMKIPEEELKIYNTFYINNENIFPNNIPDSIIMIQCNNCKFTYLPIKFPKNIITININHSIFLKKELHFNNIPTLQYLYLNNNMITKLTFNNLPNLLIIWCEHNDLVSIPENIPESVEELILNNNEIKEINYIPRNLKNFEISKNKISKIYDNLPTTLESINLSDNYIYNINSFNKNLIHLYSIDLSHNYIENIDEIIFPINLKNLNLSYNRIKIINNNFSEKIEEIFIQHNSLLEIPKELPNNLITLVCNNNNLEKIPDTLPIKLEELYIHNNFINYLPDNLPKELLVLSCNGNNITKIPENLPNNLNYLDISYCNLNYIPETLPPNLNNLLISGNKIIKLPDNLPRTINSLMINDNLITNFPLSIINLNLYSYDFTGNTIDITNPIIKIWYERLLNLNETTNINKGNIYIDSQNVHNPSVNNGINKAIRFLCSRNINPDRKFIINSLLNNKKIDKIVKTSIINYLNDDIIHMNTGYSFTDIFLMSYDIIIDKKLESIFNEEMLSAECKCFTGRINRYINVFNGIIKECTFEIADTSILPALFSHLRTKYSNNKQEIKRELLERNYEEEFINLWINYLD